MKVKIKNKTELRKLVTDRWYGMYFVLVYVDGSWDVAKESETEKINKLKNYSSAYLFKGFLYPIQYSDNEYFVRYYYLNKNELASMFFGDVENNCFTEAAIARRKEQKEKKENEKLEKKNLEKNIKENAEKRLEELEVLKNKSTNKDKELLENIIKEYKFLSEKF